MIHLPYAILDYVVIQDTEVVDTVSLEDVLRMLCSRSAKVKVCMMTGDIHCGTIESVPTREDLLDAIDTVKIRIDDNMEKFAWIPLHRIESVKMI